FDVEIAVELVWRIDEGKRKSSAKVIGGDFLLGKDLHFIASQIVGIDEEVAIKVLQALEIDNIFGPGRMGAQPEAARLETARAEGGEGKCPPVGHVALDARIGKPERGEQPEPLPVHIGEKPGLVEDFEVYREAIVDLIRYAHGDSVLEGLPAIACFVRSGRV